MTVVQVNINSKVSNKSIRREKHNGKDHFVVSSATLPFGVIMNGGLYTRETIEANYESLEGTLAPLGHPVIDGEYISAFSAEGINQSHIGAWNRGVRIEGNRVLVDKWIDIEVANLTEKGRGLIGRLEGLEKGEGEPISTSVAAFLEKMPAPQGAKYEWVANITRLDHDAILLAEEPAAKTSQGVGMMVNADDAQPVDLTQDALEGLSYRQRENMLYAALRGRFNSDERHAWVQDFTDTDVVIRFSEDEKDMIYGYKIDGGKAEIDLEGSPVLQRTFWQPVVNLAKKIFNRQPTGINPQESQDMTPEDIAKLLADVKQVVNEAVDPLKGQITELKANQDALSESVTANAKAEEAEKRKAVAAVHGDIVANALQGEALDAMHKSLGTAATIAANSMGTGTEPDFSQASE